MKEYNMLFAFWIFDDIQLEKKNTNMYHQVFGFHFYLGSIIWDWTKLNAYMHTSGYKLWNRREGPSNLNDLKCREILFSFTCNVWFIIIVIILLKSISITLLFIKPLCGHKILSVIRINTSIFPYFGDFFGFLFWY